MQQQMSHSTSTLSASYPPSLPNSSSTALLQTPRRLRMVAGATMRLPSAPRARTPRGMVSIQSPLAMLLPRLDRRGRRPRGEAAPKNSKAEVSSSRAPPATG